MDEAGFMQILVIILVIGLGIYVFRLLRLLRLEKRIAKFSLVSISTTEVSFLDNIFSFIIKVIKKISGILEKSVVITKKSKKYDKYISVNNKNNLKGIDYISFKVLLGITILFLGFISLGIRSVSLNFGVFLLILMTVFVVPNIVLKVQYNMKRKKIAEDLLKAIIIMNSAFGSGRNIVQAILSVIRELDGPIKDEFQKIYLDINYGLAMDVVFKRFYERVKLEDAKHIATSLSLLNKTGGDIVKIFKMIEKSIFDKKRLKEELNSLTASSILVFRILVVMPILLVLLIGILNPSYFKILFTTVLGGIVLVFTLLLYILYILIIRNILEVEM